jgi:hypothetical protein
MHSRRASKSNFSIGVFVVIKFEIVEFCIFYLLVISDRFHPLTYLDHKGVVQYVSVALSWSFTQNLVA